MSEEVEPRVWTWKHVSCPPYWRWSVTSESWGKHSNDMWSGFFFVPGCEPKPTIDPSNMKTIATCDKVDW